MFIDGAMAQSDVPEPNNDNARSIASLRSRMSVQRCEAACRQQIGSTNVRQLIWSIEGTPMGESNVVTMFPVVTTMQLRITVANQRDDTPSNAPKNTTDHNVTSIRTMTTLVASFLSAPWVVSLGTSVRYDSVLWGLVMD